MADSLKQLEERLSELNAQVEAYLKRARKAGGGFDFDEFRKIKDAECRAEFELAMAREQEAAEVIEWPLQWDTGAPIPFVVASELTTYVVYAVRQPPSPDWDGTWVRIRKPGSDTSEPLAIVKFSQCYGHRFGGPNDEVASGHPLHGKGLSWYAAHLVHNSLWLAQEEATNSVHSGYDPSHWKKYRHYLLCFHDSVFECLAKNYEVECIESSYEDALSYLAHKIVQ